jgi:peptide/nickel transport system permease protein
MTSLARVVLSRVLAAVPLLLGVSLISFLLLHLAPGSFMDRFRLDPRIPEQTLEVLVQRFGLDQPWYEQYVSWLSGLFRGDLGFSLTYQRPVSQLLGQSTLYTLSLAATAGMAAVAGGLALAMIALLRPGGRLDRALSATAFGVVSIPTLVLALAGLELAALSGQLPFGAGTTLGISSARLVEQVTDFSHHLLLPALVLSISLGPLFFVQARGALLEVLPSGYAVAARSRGLSQRRVLVTHCLRPALIPVLSFAGSSVGRVLNGAFLVEVVTGWPGMGRLAWTALHGRDPFLVMGVLVLAASLMLAGNLLADLGLAVVDPRIRMEEA